MIRIGITGTLGAGKGTVVSFLVEQKGFTHYSARSFITEEIERRRLPVNRDTMREVANDLGRIHGPQHVIASLLERAERDGGNAVLESVRRPAEVDVLKQSSRAYLLAVDADPQIRYERIQKRASETDRVTFEEFMLQEEKEMHGSNPADQNIAACIARADARVMNNGTLEDLFGEVEAVLKEWHL